MHKTLFDMKSIIRTVDKIIYKRIKSVWRRRINVDMKRERERPHGAMTSSGKSLEGFSKLESSTFINYLIATMLIFLKMSFS